MVVGHLYPIADNGIGNGDGSMTDLDIAHLLQEMADGIGNGGKIITGQYADIAEH